MNIIYQSYLNTNKSVSFQKKKYNELRLPKVAEEISGEKAYREVS